MVNNFKNRKFDLEDRTQNYSITIRSFVKKLPRTISNIEDIKQLVKSSGSVGANYIEANESISKKDYFYRTKVCRKEAKESRYWLNLVDVCSNIQLNEERTRLLCEIGELIKIFGAIIRKNE